MRSPCSTPFRRRSASSSSCAPATARWSLERPAGRCGRGIATYGADAAYPIDELDARLRSSRGPTRLVYRLGNSYHDGRVIRLLAENAGPARAGFRSRPRGRRTRDRSFRAALSPLSRGARRQRRRAKISPPTSRRWVRPARPARFEGRRPSSSVSAGRLAAQRPIPPSWRRAPTQILHYSENRRRMEDGDLPPDRRGLRVGLPRRRHHADVPRERAVHRAPAPRVRVVLRRAARGHRPPPARQPLRGGATRQRALLARAWSSSGSCPGCGGVGWRCTTTGVLHARDGHGSGWTSTTSATTRAPPDRARSSPDGAHRRPGLYFDPEREAVTFHLREYSEDEMWERRLPPPAWRRPGSSRRRRRRAPRRCAPRFRPRPGHRCPHRGDVLVTGVGPSADGGHAEDVDEVERTCAETPHLPR